LQQFDLLSIVTNLNWSKARLAPPARDWWRHRSPPTQQQCSFLLHRVWFTFCWQQTSLFDF